MGRNWRQIPALIAGAGVLAATVYVLGSPPAASRKGPGPTGPPYAALHSESLTPTATRPSEAVARAVERAARGAAPLPYFADRREAARFLGQWQGRLVEGRALVAVADEFDAGAENGHAVPVTLWLDSGSGVMGLSGEAAFEPTPGGLKLRQLELQPVRLTLSSWEDAARQLRSAHPTGTEPGRAAAPFYGLFRFTLDGRRFAVDARTGEVTAD